MKLVIGFITYNQSTFKYLPFFWSSLVSAIDRANLIFPQLTPKILVVDNSTDNFQNNYLFLSQNLRNENYNGREVKIIQSKKNIGFSRAYNLMINSSLKDGAEIFLMLNPDVLLDVYFIEELIKAYQTDKNSAIFSPKILYWDFDNNKKTNIIDSCGVGLNYSHHFFDLNQGKEEKNVTESQKEVFGFTGAGALLNLNHIKKVAIDNGKYLEFFDELMFMYKEDIDLSYRLRLNGFNIVFIPKAKMYHHRTLSKSKFLKHFFCRKKDLGRSYSFLHQLIIIFKIKRLPFSSKIRILTFFRFLLILFYGIFFETKQLRKFIKIRPQIINKGLILKGNYDNIKKIESLMV